MQKIRDEIFNANLEVGPNLSSSKSLAFRGIPQHFGIFYALGFAMISEGALSAIYHFCPTNENFQFDTTFMYVLATLCFIKLYQFRHPDITSDAYKVFFGLAVVMFLEVLGIVVDNGVFWIISLVLYFLALLLLSTILYKMGNWSFSHRTLLKMLQVFEII